MPVEFSVAAFRFGHSMVRDDYRLNDHRPNVPILKSRSRFGPTLAGFRRLPAGFEIDWKHFFSLDPSHEAQTSLKIDTLLSGQLAHLPPDEASLPFLNLRRGSDLGLPSGGDVAKKLDVERLSEDELLAPLPENIRDRVREVVVNRTPLWYYVLCEAKARRGGGLQLGPTGGRIVAEVIIGLILGDPHSYPRQDPDWTPSYGAGESFHFTDLLRHAGVVHALE
jgi:hypothetical protein